MSWERFERTLTFLCPFPDLVAALLAGDDWDNLFHVVGLDRVDTAPDSDAEPVHVLLRRVHDGLHLV